MLNLVHEKWIKELINIRRDHITLNSYNQVKILNQREKGDDKIKQKKHLNYSMILCMF